MLVLNLKTCNSYYNINLIYLIGIHKLKHLQLYFPQIQIQNSQLCQKKDIFKQMVKMNHKHLLSLFRQLIMEMIKRESLLYKLIKHSGNSKY